MPTTTRTFNETREGKEGDWTGAMQGTLFYFLVFLLYSTNFPTFSLDSRAIANRLSQLSEKSLRQFVFSIRFYFWLKCLATFSIRCSNIFENAVENNRKTLRKRKWINARKLKTLFHSMRDFQLPKLFPKI